MLLNWPQGGLSCAKFQWPLHFWRMWDMWSGEHQRCHHNYPYLSFVSHGRNYHIIFITIITLILMGIICFSVGRIRSMRVSYWPRKRRALQSSRRLSARRSAGGWWLYLYFAVVLVLVLVLVFILVLVLVLCICQGTMPFSRRFFVFAGFCAIHGFFFRILCHINLNLWLNGHLCAIKPMISSSGFCAI